MPNGKTRTEHGGSTHSPNPQEEGNYPMRSSLVVRFLILNILVNISNIYNIYDYILTKIKYT